MNNTDFLNCALASFKCYLNTNARSNEKLKILHGAIAQDLSNRLGDDFLVMSLGFGKGREGKIKGRYIDKNVDITILKQNEPIAGIGVKFVMGNYAQNSNNYFENMLGETANIRSNGIPYFQVFVIPENLPYYDKDGTIKKWETFTKHHIQKYKVLSRDNTDQYLHTPNKTLIYILDIEQKDDILDKKSYVEKYLYLLRVKTSSTNFGEFGNNIILNDYETFIDKVVHFILSI